MASSRDAGRESGFPRGARRAETAGAAGQADSAGGAGRAGSAGGAGRADGASSAGAPARAARRRPGFGRRLLGLFVDWVVALMLGRLLFPGITEGTPGHFFSTLALLGLLHFLFVATAGGTPGHFLLRMRVVPLGSARVGRRITDGRGDRVDRGATDARQDRVGIGRAALRAFLLFLVLPALTWDRRSGRGGHEQLSGTTLARI